MGRVGPAAVERLGVDGVARGRGDEPVAVGGMDVGLRGQEEARPDPRGLCSQASAATTPRASAMPPAAITGTGPTASTTAGTSVSVEVVPRTCPPASPPWATITSTPASAAATASATEPTVWR